MSELGASMNGTVALVTGGASGIGEATARLFSARGATVVVADIDELRAASVAAEIGGISAHINVAEPDGAENLALRLDDLVGPVTVLVTSAGITQPPTPPEALDVELWDRIMDVDVRGTWLCAAAFGTRMASRGAGSIVTVASVTAMRSTPLHAYGPGKAALITLTANLAAEWGASGVRVNCVAPGYTMTPAMAALIDSGARDPALMESASALGRLVPAEDVALAIAFLSGREAASITGVVLPVDAGWLVTPPWSTYGGIPGARPTSHEKETRP